MRSCIISIMYQVVCIYRLGGLHLPLTPQHTACKAIRKNHDPRDSNWTPEPNQWNSAKDPPRLLERKAIWRKYILFWEVGDYQNHSQHFAFRLCFLPEHFCLLQCGQTKSIPLWSQKVRLTKNISRQPHVVLILVRDNVPNSPSHFSSSK